jgi:hypothetical protein
VAPRTRNVHDKGTTEKNGRLIDIVMFIAITQGISRAPNEACGELKTFLPQRSDTASFEEESWSAMERLAGPALCESPEDVSVGNDQHVAGDSLFPVLAHGRGVPLLPDFLDQPVQALGDVGRAPGFSLVFMIWKRREK